MKPLETEGLPLNGEGEPVFDSPWQARTFAMALALHQNKVFEWSEWANRLSSQIRNIEQTAPIRTSDDYFRAWQMTLEQLLEENGHSHG